MASFIAQYWLEVLFGLIVAGAGFGFRTMFRQGKALKLGLQALLRAEIIEQYNKITARGYIKIYELENIEALYKQYHALGGNGAITHLYEELKELHVGEQR